MRIQLIVGIALSLSACAEGDKAYVVGELTSDRIALSAEYSERVIAIDVAEGQAVVAGQVLVRQDASRFQARLTELRAARDRLTARLAELQRGPRVEKREQTKAGLAAAQSELQLRNAELERVSALRARGLSSADDLDRAATASKMAEANVRSARAQVEELVAGTTSEELKQAEYALAEAEARIAAAKLDVERLIIRAPVDGIVDTRVFELGEIPTPGQPVLIMLGGEQAHAQVFVPEAMRAHVDTGQTVLVAVDGIDAPFEGRVRWVASDPMFTPYFALTERDRSHLSYLAKIDFVDTDSRLPDGIPVNVVFE